MGETQGFRVRDGRDCPPVNATEVWDSLGSLRSRTHKLGDLEGKSQALLLSK